MKKEIENKEDIQLLVNRFYEQVQLDPLIGPVFLGAIQNWEPHLEKMYCFWETVLMHTHSYKGSPFGPHASLPIGQSHFTKWLLLWQQTVDAYFTGPKAEEAKWRAQKMATMFMAKIEYFKNSNETPLF